MSWKSYLFPQTILITTSPYNHHIRVNEEWGKMKLLVNGSPQSGAYIEGIWKKAFHHFSIQSHKTRNALVLGVGGGTVMSLLYTLFPDIVQTCVDIDMVIIDIAKKYFPIGQIPRVTIIHKDAKTYIQQTDKKKRVYDCIIVDLSRGRNIPSFVEQKKFLQQLQLLLTPHGFLCLNYLREKEYRVKSDHLFATLKRVFSYVADFEIANNRFFYGRP